MPRVKQTNPTRRQHGIPKATFRRLVEEIAAERRLGLRFQSEAIDALHQETEAFLEEKFQNASGLLRVWKTQTLNPSLFQIAQDLNQAQPQAA